MAGNGVSFAAAAEMAGAARVGTALGLQNTILFVAVAVAPPVFGAAVGLTSWPVGLRGRGALPAGRLVGPAAAGAGGGRPLGLGAGPGGAVADGLDVVPVRVEHERAVVRRVVDLAYARASVVAGSCGQRCGVERVEPSPGRRPRRRCAPGRRRRPRAARTPACGRGRSPGRRPGPSPARSREARARAPRTPATPPGRRRRSPRGRSPRARRLSPARSPGRCPGSAWRGG